MLARLQLPSGLFWLVCVADRNLMFTNGVISTVDRSRSATKVAKDNMYVTPPKIQIKPDNSTGDNEKRLITNRKNLINISPAYVTYDAVACH